jgi:hypothetical protein
MTLQSFIIILLLVPFLFLLLRWSKAANRYRNLYQEKLSPIVPFSDDALKEGFSKNPSAALKNLASGRVAFSWLKAFFGNVEGHELGIAQSAARRALLYILLYMIMWFVLLGIIFYFSDR